ncbi:MAG: hypothetical protein NVSMB63_07430 [Sediminibacterium sp.]
MFLFAACDKVGSLPSYPNGTPAVLSSSTNTIAATPADSNKTIVTFSWTSPKYSIDSANQKFIVEIDSSGRNFSKEVTRVVLGTLSTSFTAKEINAILLGFGFNYNTPYDVDVRITSSHANNNERLQSNVLKLKMTPYKIPPKVVPPVSGRLFIVGSATAGGWNNPVPVPTQELTKIDSVTYGGVFNLTGGQEYLILPVNGDWSTKFSVADKSVSGLSAGGDFGLGLNDNFPGPATTGMYKIILDFQKGKFTVTPFTQVLPTNLFLVGDATAGGWNNPVPVPSQQFTQVNSSLFQITVPLNGGKQYLMLPVNGDWSHKFSVADNSVAGLSDGGSFGYDLSSNFPAPAASGTYKIEANFLTYTFKVTKQ